MHSVVIIENRTESPAINVYSNSNVVFSDILKDMQSPPKLVPCENIRFDVYDNNNNQISVFWITIPPFKDIKIVIFKDYVDFVLMQNHAF